MQSEFSTQYSSVRAGPEPSQFSEAALYDVERGLSRQDKSLTSTQDYNFQDQMRRDPPQCMQEVARPRRLEGAHSLPVSLAMLSFSSPLSAASAIHQSTTHSSCPTHGAQTLTTSRFRTHIAELNRSCRSMFLHSGYIT